MPKLIVLMLVWLLWATGRDLDSLIRYWATSDYYIFASYGLPWLFFVIAAAVLFLNVASVYFLFRPSKPALRVVLTALVAGAIQNLVTFSLTMQNLPEARETYARSRELRGLPVREGALDLIFTPSAMTISLFIMLAFYGAACLLAYKKARLFS